MGTIFDSMEVIENERINCIDCSEFTDPENIADGVYKLEWKNYGMPVARKCIKAKVNPKELLLLRKVACHPNIISFYGIIKDPSNEHYNMVLEFANDGNLRDYLKIKFSKLQWIDKFNMAKEIAQGLIFLHSNNIVHHDLHSKNILVQYGKMRIADFGLSKQTNETSIISPSDSYGMPAYIEPQYFKNPLYRLDTRSDIYSFGVIMWEITSGKPPFQSFTSKEAIAIHIFQGKREKPIEGTPSEFKNLYASCWDEEPAKRPNAKYALEILNSLINKEYQKDQFSKL